MPVTAAAKFFQSCGPIEKYSLDSRGNFKRSLNQYGIYFDPQENIIVTTIITHFSNR